MLLRSPTVAITVVEPAALHSNEKFPEPPVIFSATFMAFTVVVLQVETGPAWKGVFTIMGGIAKQYFPFGLFLRVTGHDPFAAVHTNNIWSKVTTDPHAKVM